MKDRKSQVELAEQIAAVAYAVSSGQMIVVDMKTHGRLDGYVRLEIELFPLEQQEEPDVKTAKEVGATVQ